MSKILPPPLSLQGLIQWDVTTLKKYFFGCQLHHLNRLTMKMYYIFIYKITLIFLQFIYCFIELVLPFTSWLSCTEPRRWGGDVNASSKKIRIQTAFRWSVLRCNNFFSTALRWFNPRCFLPSSIRPRFASSKSAIQENGLAAFPLSLVSRSAKKVWRDRFFFDFTYGGNKFN